MLTFLPDDLVSRAMILEDLPQVVSLLNARSRDLIGVDSTTDQRLRTKMQTPGFVVETDTRIVLDGEGQIIGAAYIYDLSDPHVQVEVESVLDPAYHDHGIGDILIDWAEERASRALLSAPTGARVTLSHSVLDQDAPTQKLLMQHEFKPVRQFWRMLIEMDDSPPSPAWPTGIAVQAFSSRPDERALALAVRDAFRDHWGYVEEPIADQVMRWSYQIEHDPDFDPSLWFLAMEGEEIVGVSLCWPKAHEDPNMGYVGMLGVRRPWRQQGIGLALLRHSFGALYLRGVRKVGLDVDAASLTGATRLYKNVGMHIDRHTYTYEKELRSGRDLSTQCIE